MMLGALLRALPLELPGDAQHGRQRRGCGKRKSGVPEQPLPRASLGARFRWHRACRAQNGFPRPRRQRELRGLALKRALQRTAKRVGAPQRELAFATCLEVTVHVRANRGVERLVEIIGQLIGELLAGHGELRSWVPPDAKRFNSSGTSFSRQRNA